MKNQSPLIVILGPTASGKTHLAVNVASKVDGEIISADSRQVYKGMTIGTGKDYEEYQLNTDIAIPSHLIDIVEAGEDYHVARFQKDFQHAYEAILSRAKTSILCGGSGMYIEAVLRDYQHTQVPVNQELREQLDQYTFDELALLFLEKYKDTYPDADTSTKKRLIRAIEVADFINRNHLEKVNQAPADYIIFGIDIPVEIRRERITRRLSARLNAGMIEEVQHLLDKGIPAEKLVFYGLEYKFITEYLMGNLSYEEMVIRLEIAIHQFAKRQMTFFRSMERKGLSINWLNGMDGVENLTNQVINTIQKKDTDIPRLNNASHTN